MDDGHRLATYDTSLVVSGGVDCGRRRRNVYDEKPRRYAIDNMAARGGLAPCFRKFTGPLAVHRCSVVRTARIYFIDNQLRQLANMLGIQRTGDDVDRVSPGDSP